MTPEQSTDSSTKSPKYIYGQKFKYAKLTEPGALLACCPNLCTVTQYYKKQEWRSLRTGPTNK